MDRKVVGGLNAWTERDREKETGRGEGDVFVVPWVVKTLLL